MRLLSGYISIITLMILSNNLSAQKTVYKATHVAANEKRVVKFGSSDRMRVEDPQHPIGYDLYDFSKNEIYNIYDKYKTYKLGGAIGTYKVVGAPAIAEAGDTIISGYHCKKYIVEADEQLLNINAFVHGKYTYFSTTELSYPAPYAPSKYKSDYLPIADVKGFVLKIIMEETVVSKKKKADIPTRVVFYYTDLGFEPIPTEELALPFKQ